MFSIIYYSTNSQHFMHNLLSLSYNQRGDFMILLNKKKILFILSCITISIVFFNYNSIPDSIETSSTPVSNHVVILDAGHGLPDGGAESADGIYESTINLSIVEKLQKLLESSSCTVILTRSDENGIYEMDTDTIRQKKISDMKNRVEIGNHSEAEIFVSIHLNKIAQSQYSGWQTFYQLDNEKSLNLATNIQDNLNYSIQKENKRIPEKMPDIYLAKNLEIPFTIVECGFLSNSNECNMLQTNNYQEVLAWGIYTGIMDYFK